MDCTKVSLQGRTLAPVGDNGELSVNPGRSLTTSRIWDNKLSWAEQDWTDKQRLKGHKAKGILVQHWSNHTYLWFSRDCETLEKAEVSSKILKKTEKDKEIRETLTKTSKPFLTHSMRCLTPWTPLFLKDWEHVVLFIDWCNAYSE